jgi:hypothetical protein
LISRETENKVFFRGTKMVMGAKRTDNSGEGRMRWMARRRRKVEVGGEIQERLSQE